MTHIVGQLIDAAESDTLTIKPGEIADLRAVCTEVVTFMAPVAVSQRKSISISGEDDAVWVEGDSGALFRAIRNVVENAITHTAPGTTVDIMVGRWRISRDQGPGIRDTGRAAYHYLP